MKKVLVTGAAGFIGFHLTKKLLKEGEGAIIVGIDNLNDYYDTNLKNSRLIELEKDSKFIFKKIDITDRNSLENLFKEYEFTHVVNLAAQAGVRYAKENPKVYIDTNVQGFFNVVDLASQMNVERLIYASSSSVYGANTSIPFKESDSIHHPMSLYAATKTANEATASAYFYTHG